MADINILICEEIKVWRADTEILEDNETLRHFRTNETKRNNWGSYREIKKFHGQDIIR